MLSIRLLTRIISLALNYFRSILVPDSPPSWNGFCLSHSLFLSLTAVGVLPALFPPNEDSERWQGSGRRSLIDLGIGGAARMERQNQSTWIVTRCCDCVLFWTPGLNTEKAETRVEHNTFEVLLMSCTFIPWE